MNEITHLDLAVATAAPRAFNRIGWAWELKYDGLRVLATNTGGHLRLLSRNGTELGHAFPELVEELTTLKGHYALDGELVVLDTLGNPRFGNLAKRARLKKAGPINAAARRDPAAIFAFDALVLDGKDIRRQPLKKRKELLLHFLRHAHRVRYLPHVEERGEALYEQAMLVDFEGVIGKPIDRDYRAGRDSGWIKVKTSAGKERQRERGGIFNEARVR